MAAKMGLAPALLVHPTAIGSDYTFFVVYGSVTHLVDLRAVTVIGREFELLSAKEINAAIKTRLRRPLVVVGGASGPTRTPWASTRSSTSRGSPATRGWSTTRGVVEVPARG